MKGLIIDTSKESCLLGLTEEGVSTHWEFFIHQNQLSKYIFPLLQSLVEAHHPFNYIGVGIGPGSFTGTRIGVSIAKGLSYAWTIPLIGFASPLAFEPDAKATLPILLHEKYLLKEYTLKGELDLTY